MMSRRDDEVIKFDPKRFHQGGLGKAGSGPWGTAIGDMQYDIIYVRRCRIRHDFLTSTLKNDIF